GGDLADAAAAADGLVVEVHAAGDLGVLVEPLGVDGIRKRRARTIDEKLSRCRAHAAAPRDHHGREQTDDHVTSSLTLPPGPQCAPGVFRKSYGFVTTSLRWLAEPVADPADSIDSRRRQLGQDEFPAQPGEVDVHRPGLDEAIAAPDDVEQLVAAEDTA